MMINKICLFLVLVFLFLGINAYAADQTYYVTFAGATGKDGKAIGSAWDWEQFFDAANWDSSDNADKIDPGDTVVLSGTFTFPDPTNHYIPGSGTAGNHIIIDGNDGVNPAVDWDPPNHSGESCSFFAIGKSYLEIKNMTFTGRQYCAMWFQTCDNILIHDNTINGRNDMGIRLRVNCHDIDIYDNYLTTSHGDTDVGNDGLQIYGAYDVNVYRNEFVDWNHSALSAASLAGTAYYVRDIDIYNNKFSLPNRGYGRAFDFGCVTPGYNYNISFHHNYATGMRAESEIQSGHNFYIYNNIFHNQLNCCEEVSGDCLEIYKNNAGDIGCDTKTFYKVGAGLSLQTNYGTLSYVYVYNNTFWKSAEKGISLSSSAGVTDNIHIENNIFYDTARAATPEDNPPGSTQVNFDNSAVFYLGAYAMTNVTFKNNVIWSLLRTTGSDIYYQGSLYTLAGFELAAPTIASGNVNELPVLTDPDSDDFTLVVGDPGIGQALTLGSDYEDGWKAGSSMPPTAVTTATRTAPWDVGAYIANVAEASGTVFTGLGGGSISESQIADGKTVDWTIAGTTWVATLGDDNAFTTAFIAGIREVGTPATNGWDNEVVATLDHTDFTRVSSTVFRLTLNDAVAGFDLDANITVRTTVPATAVASADEIVASPDFTISAEVSAPALTVNNIGVINDANGATGTFDVSGKIVIFK